VPSTAHPAAAAGAARASACSRSAAAGAASPKWRRATGCRCTGITLSPAQLAWAQRAHAAPASTTGGSRSADYRDTAARFDHIVSIEMFEAVGERWWPTYFAPWRQPGAGRPRGGAEHHHPRRPLRALPQGHRLHPAVHLPRRHAAVAHRLPRRPGAAAGLEVRDAFAFGSDYARTLAEWARTSNGSLAADRRARFRRALPSPVALLSRLLRGGLRRKLDRRRPVRTAHAPEASGWLLLLMLLAAPLRRRCPRRRAARPGWRRWGSGEMTWFGFLYAPRCGWRRGAANLGRRWRCNSTTGAHRPASASSDTSEEEMRRFGADEAELARWREAMRACFPDVREGDTHHRNAHALAARASISSRPPDSARSPMPSSRAASSPSGSIRARARRPAQRRCCRGRGT
jgi:hypothetical protein